jgi:hypothetical protein
LGFENGDRLVPILRTGKVMNANESTPNLMVWNKIVQALEAEFVNVPSIRGMSGLYHPVYGLGKDERRRRLIVIVAETSGRNAALVQSDVQALMPEWSVMALRPSAGIILPLLAEFITESEHWSSQKKRVLKAAAHLSSKNFLKNVESKRLINYLADRRCSILNRLIFH